MLADSSDLPFIHYYCPKVREVDPILMAYSADDDVLFQDLIQNMGQSPTQLFFALARFQAKRAIGRRQDGKTNPGESVVDADAVPRLSRRHPQQMAEQLTVFYERMPQRGSHWWGRYVRRT